MRCSWLSTVAVLAVGVPAAAESFRTLIMVDASSSMRRTDPQKLRKVAAELYVDLAREGDLIAIWQFDRSAKDVSQGFQKITGPEVRHRLKDAVRSIGDEGDWTDFGAAFGAVAQAFGDKPAPGEKRFLVFLTDGKCEPAPEEARYLKEGEKPSKKASAEREERCKHFVLSQALPKLQGVETEIVGLSRGAPREFLEEVSRRTGGRAAVTERAEDLPHLFAKIHAYNAGARVAEAKGRELPVDRLVASMDLVIVAPRDVEVALARPDGSFVSTDERGLYFVHSERYRFFHLPRPVPGTWRIRPSRMLPAGAVAAIQNYDLHLRLEAPEHVTVGQPIDVKVVLAAGEGSMPEASFLARHEFLAQARVRGAIRMIELRESPDGSRTGSVPTAEPGSIELSARVEPGRDGALTRVALPTTVTVIPPLELAVTAPLSLGGVKPGTTVEQRLDLSGSQFLGEVGLEVRSDGIPFEVRPTRLALKADLKRFDLRFELPGDAEPGPVAGALRLLPVTEPYVGREGTRVPVTATVLPLTFWERHGGKVTLGALGALLSFVFAGFKTPARFPPRLRVYYQDKPNQDEGDFGLWMRAKPGFFRPATFKIGGGGPIRRTSPLLCAIVATPNGVVVRPAEGRSLKADGGALPAQFQPAHGVKYAADDGLVFWIGREEEE